MYEVKCAACQAAYADTLQPNRRMSPSHSKLRKTQSLSLSQSLSHSVTHLHANARRYSNHFRPRSGVRDVRSRSCEAARRMRSIVCLYDNTRYRVASAFVTHGAFYTRYDDVIRITLVTLVTLGRVAAKQRSGVLQGLWVVDVITDGWSVTYQHMQLE